MNRPDRPMPQSSDRVVLLAAGALSHPAAPRGNPYAGTAGPGSQQGNNVMVLRPPMAGTQAAGFSSAAGSTHPAPAIKRMGNKSALFRLAAAADVAALAGLIGEPMVAMHEDQAAPGTQRDAGSIALDELHDARIDTLVAEAGEGLQGFLQLRWDARPPSAEWMRGAVELRRHYVRARHRGAGVAAGLLEAAVVLAGSRDATGLWLGSRSARNAGTLLISIKGSASRLQAAASQWKARQGENAG